jgi:hypothetical protein
MKNKPSVFDTLVNMDWGKLWPQIKAMEAYSVECDDAQGIITVICAPDGDLHLMMDDHERMDCKGDPGFRVRTYFGGGNKERVRRALLLLALAIKEDEDPNIDDAI